MKGEFIKYLDCISITNALRGRIETIYKLCKQLCPEEIKDIFITDYIKEDGSRVYENLWFFSEKNCMEAKNFRAVEDFDIIPMKKRVTFWNIKIHNYDFKKATDTSRLFLAIRFDIDMAGYFKAAKENCDYLKEIIFKYAMKNIKE